MVCFMNPLSTFESQVYLYFDQPGTPVEVIGTVIMAIMRPATNLGSDAFRTHLLMRPELFLGAAHGLLTLASICTLIYICAAAIGIQDWTSWRISALRRVSSSFFSAMRSTR
jgi:hypothetical protein